MSCLNSFLIKGRKTGARAVTLRAGPRVGAQKGAQEVGVKEPFPSIRALKRVLASLPLTLSTDGGF